MLNPKTINTLKYPSEARNAEAIVAIGPSRIIKRSIRGYPQYGRSRINSWEVWLNIFTNYESASLYEYTNYEYFFRFVYS